MKTVTVAGKEINLHPIKEEVKRKLWPGLTVSFNLYLFDLDGNNILLLQNKENTEYSPGQKKKISERIKEILGIPSAFYFESLPTFQRDRIVAQGVYFIVSNKFAFLPNLYANRILRKSLSQELLLPSAQYLLLYHLQATNINNLTISDLAKTTPYKYSTLAKALQHLKEKGLLDIHKGKNSDNIIHIDTNRSVLWEKAKPFLSSPIKRIGYLSQPFSEGFIGGITALAHYSMLSSEKVPTKVLTSINNLPLLPYEEEQRIEIWKYPPINPQKGYVDKLSLYLSLLNDKDPRIEKELEIMINQTIW